MFASQLSDFIERPETIPRRISEYSSSIGSLSAWCNDIKSQPLDIDYIYLAGSRAPMPRPKVGFVERLVHEVKSLFYSFVEDYTMVSTGGDAAESGSIEVWASTGRIRLGNPNDGGRHVYVNIHQRYAEAGDRGAGGSVFVRAFSRCRSVSGAGRASERDARRAAGYQQLFRF